MTDTGEWTTRRYLSLLGSITIWVIVAIDAWFLWPAQLGGSTSMVIVSGISMEPTYFDGDLVIARKVEPTVGDVIVYAPEGLGGAQIVHRIIGGNATDGWELQGDNNDFVDPFTPKGDEVKGVVLVHYSNFGRVTVLLLNPIVWSFVLLAAIVLMVWYGGDTCEDDPRDDDDEDDDASAAGGAPSDTSDVVEDDVVDDPLKEEVTVGAVVSPHEGGLATHTRARVVAAIGAVVLALGLSVTPASASQLSVNTAGGLAAMKYQRCAAQTLAAATTGTPTAGNYTQISFTGITNACAGIPVVVYLHDASGAVVTTATGNTALGTTTLTTAAPYNSAAISRVVIAIRGWLYFPSYTPVIPAYACVAVNPGGNTPGGSTCVVSNVSVNTWTSGGYSYANVQMTITSSMNNALVTLDLSKAPFPGWKPLSVQGNSDFVKATQPAPAYQCSSLPVLKLNRNTSNGSWNLYFQMTTQPNAYGGPTVICQ